MSDTATEQLGTDNAQTALPRAQMTPREVGCEVYSLYRMRASSSRCL